MADTKYSEFAFAEDARLFKELLGTLNDVKLVLCIGRIVLVLDPIDLCSPKEKTK